MTLHTFIVEELANTTYWHYSCALRYLCRRTKRPDQALYVPGALGKVKNDQMKESASSEISKISDINIGVTPCAPKDDSHPSKEKQCSQTCESKLNDTLCQDIPLCTEELVDDVAARIESTSLEGNMEHACTNMASDLSVNERLQNAGIGDEGGKIALPNSGSKIEFPESSSEAYDKESVDSSAKVINESDQTLDTSSQSRSFSQENCCDKDVGLENGLSHAFTTTGNGTVCKERIGKCIVDTKHDSCIEMEEKIVSERNQGTVYSTENDSDDSNLQKTETQSLKEDSISKGNFNDSPFDEQKAETKGGVEERRTDLDLPIDDLEPAISILSRGDNANEARTGISALHSESDSVNLDDSVIEEGYNILSDPGSYQQQEKVKNKEFLDDHTQPEATLEGVESSSVVGEGLSQPCGATSDTPVARTGPQTYPTNVQIDHQGLPINNYNAKLGEDATPVELGSSQPSMSKEERLDEAGIKSMEMTSASVCEDAENCENQPSRTLDVSPTSLVLEKNSASQRFKSDVGHLNENAEELHTQTEITGEEAHEVYENKHGVSNLSVTELNENVGEPEMQHDKTLKKKKRKKDKDGKENKSKCKEKGEKTKRKEKKNSKEKSDKDENLDSKQKEKKHKKSKSKEESPKQGDAEDLNACGKVIERETSTQIKLQAGSSIEKKDNDSEDDDDNWESNFSESGDCLNPEHSEEVCIRDRR